MGHKQSKTSNVKPIRLQLIDKKRSRGLLSAIKSGRDNVYEIFYKKITAIDDTRPVDIIITTHGGQALWCSKICYVLKHRTGTTRVFVKSYAHSAGTVIALAASELYITSDTTFSAIDAQGFPLDDLLQTSLQILPKILQNPRDTLVEMTTERVEYFRKETEKYINDKLHDKDLIMKNMHDGVPIHEQLFFKEDMNELGIKYKLWNGDVSHPQEIKTEIVNI
jgi:hypothetical protein